tara:strand:- start:526 stop:795 length:270 start_codon:yes stop_codon:yes gene_type:complete
MSTLLWSQLQFEDKYFFQHLCGNPKTRAILCKNHSAVVVLMVMPLLVVAFMNNKVKINHIKFYLLIYITETSKFCGIPYQLGPRGMFYL